MINVGISLIWIFLFQLFKISIYCKLYTYLNNGINTVTVLTEPVPWVKNFKMKWNEKRILDGWNCGSAESHFLTNCVFFIKLTIKNQCYQWYKPFKTISPDLERTGWHDKNHTKVIGNKVIGKLKMYRNMLIQCFKLRIPSSEPKLDCDTVYTDYEIQ